MESLVDNRNIPSEADEAEGKKRFDAEAVAAGKLMVGEYLVRLWQPRVVDDEIRVLGSCRGESERALRGLLGALSAGCADDDGDYAAIAASERSSARRL